MAQEILVKEALTEKMIEAGAELIQRLAKTDFKLVAALWLWHVEPAEWWLTLSSPWIDKHGLNKAYRKIDEALSKPEPISGLKPLDISAVETNAPLIKALRDYAKERHTNLVNTRLKYLWFGDGAVDEAYIYFVK